jgi:hypothetical protein
MAWTPWSLEHSCVVWRSGHDWAQTPMFTSHIITYKVSVPGSAAAWKGPPVVLDPQQQFTHHCACTMWEVGAVQNPDAGSLCGGGLGTPQCT